MLARLEQIEGIDEASVDFGGTHLRLSGRGSAAEDAIALLRELGYEPEPVAASDDIPTKWYDLDSVDALSSVEADVIARRVVGKLGARVSISADDAARLRDRVAGALRKCFLDRDTRKELAPARFRDTCVERATEAARSMLAPDHVAEFVATLETDLNENHTHDAGL